MKNRQLRIFAICGITFLAALALFFVPAIPQPLSYHLFADKRNLLGISNCLNVLSNLPFLFVGIRGLRFVLKTNESTEDSVFSDPRERWPYAVFFLGVALTAFGSAYYHFVPNNGSLVWDRLPMTFAFLSFLAAIIAERISIDAGIRFLLPLILFGIASVAYWHLTELRGHGDLRPYLFAQFFPMLIIPAMIFLFPPRYTRTFDLLGVFAAYAVAKLFEFCDQPIYSLGHVVSGHTLKHLSAAFASYLVLRNLHLRTAVHSAAVLSATE